MCIARFKGKICKQIKVISYMKKIIFVIFLGVTFFTSASLTQTKRRPIRKRAVIKPAATKKTTERINNQMTGKAINNQAAITTDSGLTYIVTKRGTGAQLKAGETVAVNYTGLLTNGTKFDSSLDRGQPISFELGAGRVIKGWDEGLQKLHVGDHATFIIPPDIAYGASGFAPVIPPDATLVFIIEVVGVK